MKVVSASWLNGQSFTRNLLKNASISGVRTGHMISPKAEIISKSARRIRFSRS